MLSLDQQIATIKKELNALKAGFTGGQTRFNIAVSTEQNYLTDGSIPLKIQTDFPFQDFPALYMLVNTTGGYIASNSLIVRTNLYEWYIPPISSINPVVSLDLLLLSQYTPSLFVVGAA